MYHGDSAWQLLVVLGIVFAMLSLFLIALNLWWMV